jgi:hypothetical protein
MIWVSQVNSSMIWVSQVNLASSFHGTGTVISWRIGPMVGEWPPVMLTLSLPGFYQLNHHVMHISILFTGKVYPNILCISLLGCILSPLMYWCSPFPPRFDWNFGIASGWALTIAWRLPTCRFHFPSHNFWGFCSWLFRCWFQCSWDLYNSFGSAAHLPNPVDSPRIKETRPTNRKRGWFLFDFRSLIYHVCATMAGAIAQLMARLYWIPPWRMVLTIVNPVLNHVFFLGGRCLVWYRFI